MMVSYKKSLVFCLASLLAVQALAQNLERHNWYFGNTPAGIRFNRVTAKASLLNNQAIPFGTGGSAVVTDPANANLLFYTDGLVVYDATHALMVNGGGLTGNNAGNQPVAVCAIPGQPNKYFIFTNSANFTTGGVINYSIVDRALFGNAGFPAPALGEVTATKNVNIPTLANRSEGMMIIPHSNGTDFWLITHQNNSQNYAATLINAASFTGTFNTTVTSGLALPLTVASFSYHAGLNKVAVAPQSSNEDAIILDFNNATGNFSFDRYIYNTGKVTATNQSIYDIEWSLSGQYLYLSRYGEAGINAELIQYDYVNSNTSTPLTILTSILPTPVFRSFGLQMAPDSAIYHLYQATTGGPFLLGKLTNSDSVASSVIYTPLPLGNSDFNAQQFPSFAPRANVNLAVTFTSIGTCQNSPTTFFPNVIPAADSLTWDFGDTNTSTGWSPVHTYAVAQAYNVTLTAYYHGQQAQAVQPVTINAFPLQLQLVQDTTACRSEFPAPRGSASPTQFSVKANVTGGTPTSYTWSNGDTGQILTPDSAGYYYVVVTDPSGCTAYAGVNVKEYGLQDQRANIWYFGTHAGIDFNVRPPQPLNVSAMDAPEGCAIICDRNGQVIFYTDGNSVWDKTNTLITTLPIGGDLASTQSSLVVPVPGDETLYYIFTTQAINGTSANEVRYSLFDLKLNAGKGAVVQQNILLFAKSTERITANGNWLVIHELGNSSFHAYPISAQGIGDPVITDIGSIHSSQVQQNGEGYMKLGPRNDLAVALSTPGTSNIVELFHLNDTTGTINNYRKIDLKEPNGQVYGIEFSPGGNKLFASVKGTPSPSKIFEYFIDSIGHPYFKQQIPQPLEIGALQLGPDGQIYAAINGSGVLGTIIANDDTTQLSSFNANGFNLAAGTLSKLGLPNFVQHISNAFGGPGFDFTGVCLGQPTQFVGTATDAIDQFQWFFGDGGSDTQPSPIHTYAAVGTYTVSMRLTNRCGLDTTIVKQIKIDPTPARPTLPGATALCTGNVVLDANSTNTPGLTYLWSSGETTKTITVTEQSFISVTNTDANGCTSNAVTIVADNRPQVDLGPDVSICEDNATPGLNAQNPGASYQWQINGVNSGNAQAQGVDTTLPGLFVYQVTVTDPVTTCSATDTKTYNIKVSPSFALSGTNPTGCGLTNGSIALTLNTSAPAGGPYSYFLTGPGGFNDLQIDQTAPNVINYAGRGAGTYSGIVTDQISGCTISTSFGLSDAAFTANASALAPNCDPVTLVVTSTAVALPLQYRITQGATVVAGPTSSPTASFNTPPLPAGTYTLELTDNGGCILTVANTITPNPPVPITLTSNLCVVAPANPTLTAAGATSYSWTGPSIVGAATGATISINPGPGQFTYSVTASAAGQCPATQSITVDVDNATNATFTQSDACQTSVLLSAAPSGTYTYRWFKGGVFQPALMGQTISLGQTEDGSSYSVSLVSTLNGCVYTSAPKVVNIVGPVTATLTSTPACLDNKPFTLTSTTTATGVTYAWSLDGSVISGATTPSINQTSDGTYKVDITKSVCTTSAQLNIIKAPIPEGQLPNRVVICADPDNQDPATSQFDLDPGAFTSYNWFKNELSLNYTQRTLTADTKGIYRVDLTNSFGCTAPDETEVLSECIPKIDAPTAFRPTSKEPANRDFYVFSYFITDEFQVFIYNRWGELVFESNDRNFKWNGGFKNNQGQPLPGGAYAYVIKYVSSFRPDLGIQEKHGGVALIR